ncbi:MAG TPA: putative dsRNA-binding protein, partial [Ilumatobacteraceae bacterium]
LDGGSEEAYRVIERIIGPRLDAAVGSLDQLDNKSTLQEITARLGLGAPEYIVRSEGPDHAKRFFASVVVEGRVIGEGSGRSKKAAEQQAATAACATLLAPGVD